MEKRTVDSLINLPQELLQPIQDHRHLLSQMDSSEVMILGKMSQSKTRREVVLQNSTVFSTMKRMTTKKNIKFRLKLHRSSNNLLEEGLVRKAKAEVVSSLLMKMRMKTVLRLFQEERHLTYSNLLPTRAESQAWLHSSTVMTMRMTTLFQKLKHQANLQVFQECHLSLLLPLV